MMVIQSWLIAGLILGGLAGLIMSKGYGIAGYIVVGIIGGLVGGSLASILFVVAETANESSVTSMLTVLGSIALVAVIGKIVVSQVSSRLNDRGDAARLD